MRLLGSGEERETRDEWRWVARLEILGPAPENLHVRARLFEFARKNRTKNALLLRWKPQVFQTAVCWQCCCFPCLKYLGFPTRNMCVFGSVPLFLRANLNSMARTCKLSVAESLYDLWGMLLRYRILDYRANTHDIGRNQEQIWHRQLQLLY